MDLVDDVRHLGCDVNLWHPRMVEGLCELVGARVGIGSNMRNFSPDREPEGLGVYRIGWSDEKAERVWREYVNNVPVRSTPEFKQMAGFRGLMITRTRGQIYRDELWYRSKTFNEVHKACGIDHYVFSIARLPRVDHGKDLFNSVWVHRPLGSGMFGRREWWLVRTVHGRLAQMVGRELATPVEPGPTRLSPRRRQVLAALLEGDSEKQVAGRLGLKPATVHEHVAAIYGHFGVSSRAELMATFVGRTAPD